MDSRRRQRSIALSHIAPLPIPHGLEYPLGYRMYLVVIHPQPEARGQPFPRFPRSRSRVNLRVLRPFTRGPQSQPSPLQTPHGRPGVQGTFPTSRGQVPRGWPTVPHSMATGFLISRVCCVVLSALFPLSHCVHNPRISLSPLPHPRHWPSLHTSPLIRCLYPSTPPATPWRGPTGSSSIWGPFRASCTGRS